MKDDKHLFDPKENLGNGGWFDDLEPPKESKISRLGGFMKDNILKYADFIFLYIGLYNMIGGTFTIMRNAYQDKVGEYSQVSASLLLLSLSMAYFIIRVILYTRK